jgi:VanZ family protein
VLTKKTYLFLAILWTIVVTLLSLITISSSLASAIPIPNKDKYVHFTFYFVFVVLWFLYSKSENSDPKSKFSVLLASIGYGILMEICQGLFTNYRTPDIYDVLANSAGAILGLFFISFIKRKKATQ